MNQKRVINFALIVLVAAIIGVVGYFAITKKPEPVTQQQALIPAPAKTPDQVSTSTDPIERLTVRLSSDPLWQNGISPLITLPATASSEQVISQVFEMTSFDQGRVTNYQILNAQEVHIRGGLPDQYTAVLVKTDFGEKIVLLQYSGQEWWSRVYDPD